MSKDYITVDTKKFFSLVVRLGGLPDQMANATYSAVKRTLTQVRTEIGRIVPKEYQIKASDVKSAIGNPKVKKGRISEASLLVKGRTLSFAHFRFTPTKRTKRNVPVKVKIFKQTAKKRVNTVPMPFVAHTGAVSDAKTQYNVFRRTGPERLPITVLRSFPRVTD